MWNRKTEEDKISVWSYRAILLYVYIISFQVTFDSVGGLGKHIRKLKEMIVFPLLYPEVFERFKIQPPRGCLFYGPPGMHWRHVK